MSQNRRSRRDWLEKILTFQSLVVIAGSLFVSTHSFQCIVHLLEWVTFSWYNTCAVMYPSVLLTVEGSHLPLGTNLLWEGSKSTHCSKGFFWCSSTSQEWLHPLTKQFLIVLLLYRLYNIFEKQHRYPDKTLCLRYPSFVIRVLPISSLIYETHPFSFDCLFHYLLDWLKANARCLVILCANASAWLSDW